MCSRTALLPEKRGQVSTGLHTPPAATCSPGATSALSPEGGSSPPCRGLLLAGLPLHHPRVGLFLMQTPSSLDSHVWCRILNFPSPRPWKSPFRSQGRAWQSSACRARCPPAQGKGFQSPVSLAPTFSISTSGLFLFSILVTKRHQHFVSANEQI